MLQSGQSEPDRQLHRLILRLRLTAPLHLPEEQAGEGVLPLPLPQGPGRPGMVPQGQAPEPGGELPLQLPQIQPLQSPLRRRR